MKFLVDAQLPPDLARWLIGAGFQAQAVRDLGLREAKDAEIWRYAHEHSLVIITKDDDFAARVQSSRDGPHVVWLRVGNTSNAALRSWLLPRMPQVIEMLDQGARLVEIR